MRVVLLLAGLSILSACMGEIRYANVRPNVTITKSVSGKGAVALSIVDERSSTTVSDLKTGGSNIRLIEPIPLVEPTLKQALSENGFTPVEKASATDRRLKVEIRAIELKIAGGFATTSYLTNAALKVIANSKEQTFERFYRSEAMARSAVGSDERNDQLVSEALSKAMSDVANDAELMAFLAR